jgi:hypothetical protein
VKSGITKGTSSLLCVFAAVNGAGPASRLELPHGFTASVYARGIDGATGLEILADGTLTLQGDAERFEIVPPTADEPLTIMRVAAGLEDTVSDANATALTAQAPRFVRMRWNARSGELAYVLARDAGAHVSVAASTLALARALAERHHADVAVAPDGTLYYADSEAGAVWRIAPSRL